MSRHFLALEIPETIAANLRQSLGNWQNLIANRIPQINWHITIVDLGQSTISDSQLEILQKPLPLTYAPIINLQYVGKGLVDRQLWAYAKATADVLALQKAVTERLHTIGLSTPNSREYIPHIHLADLLETSSLVKHTQEPLQVTFRPRMVSVFRSIEIDNSVQYERIGSFDISQ